MRSWIERLPADEQATVVASIERWRRMQHEGWQLTVVHRHRPQPELVAFGWLPEQVQLRLTR
jgi:hypothetical protein